MAALRRRGWGGAAAVAMVKPASLLVSASALTGHQPPQRRQHTFSTRSK